MGIKRETATNTVIVVYFNTFDINGYIFRQKINKDILTLNNMLDKMDLIDIFQAFKAKTEE